MRALERGVGWTLAHSRLTIGASVVALAFAGFGATRLDEQFFPPSDRPELLISLRQPQSASLEATDEKAKRLEALLKNDPNVERAERSESTVAP
jgi:multidrug efflux pump subunit AcrB